jgi:hypothetical protein
MTGREKVQAARDALARARQADERLRTALAECTLWLGLALDDVDEGGDTRAPRRRRLDLGVLVRLLHLHLHESPPSSGPPALSQGTTVGLCFPHSAAALDQ